MYPSGELEALAHRKAIIEARIAVHRWKTAAAVAELVRPIAQLDRGFVLWQRFSPFFKFLALPSGFILTRLLGRGRRRRRKRGWIGTLLSSLPLIFRGVKMALALRSAYGHRAPASAGAKPASERVLGIT